MVLKITLFTVQGCSGQMNQGTSLKSQILPPSKQSLLVAQIPKALKFLKREDSQLHAASLL